MEKKQEKFSEKELAKYRSFIVGLAAPSSNGAGFISCFGITTEPGPEFHE